MHSNIVEQNRGYRFTFRCGGTTLCPQCQPRLQLLLIHIAYNDHGEKMLTYVLTALQEEKESQDRQQQQQQPLQHLRFMTISNTNTSSPISSFRNNHSDEDNNNCEPEIETTSPNTVDLTTNTSTQIPEQLLFPTTDDTDKDTGTKMANATSDMVLQTSLPPLEANEKLVLSWEERIEQEIAAARAAATTTATTTTEAKEVAFDATSSNNNNTAILHDESMNSVNSYELLQQNVQMGDLIAKERFLSFDSKEDIDFAENRGIWIAQRLQQQQSSSQQTIIMEEQQVMMMDDSGSALSSPGLHVVSDTAQQPPHPTGSFLEDSFGTIDSGVGLEKEAQKENSGIAVEDVSRLILESSSPATPWVEHQQQTTMARMDSESTRGVRNTSSAVLDQSSSIYSTTVPISESSSARVYIMTNNDGNVDGNVDEKKDEEIRDCLSASESEVASIDGLPTRLQKKWKSSPEQMMKSLDGIGTVRRRSHTRPTQPLPPRGLSRGTRRREHPGIADLQEDCSDFGTYFEPCFNFPFWGECAEEKTTDGKRKNKKSWKEQHDVPLAILDCSNLIHQEDRVPPPVTKSMIHVASDHPSPSYAETILPTEVDPRMQDWIAGQFRIRSRPPADGSFHLGESRTVIVHEINRGDWTWCTEWSPDGALLAIATENHHLAIVDTTSSTVWRVRHDRKVRGPTKNDTTHSIRAIAWGSSYIAIGGTGNAVSILAPRDPYQILHTIKGTGFVGCLDWRGDSNILAIGSRLDFAMVVRIRTNEDADSPSQQPIRVESELLHRIKYNYWVNSISFSPDGSYLAVGDSGGIVSVYDYDDLGKEVETNMIAWFKRKSALLSIDWSPDGKWLYAGGEDRSVTVIDTNFWEIVHRLGRDRWVQCIAASNGGSHVAVGGVSSEISLLDVDKGWDSVMGVELKGLVPLSAKWHPKDQYLAVTGQDTSVLVVETTNARHVKGHHLHSISPVLAIEFSPDGRMAIIGNEAGIVTFYSLSGTTFITAYELVVQLDTNLCTEWSRNGMFAVIGAMDNLTVVGRRRNKRQGKKCPPNASGFSIKKVLRDIGETHSVSIDWKSHYVAVSGASTVILDVRADFTIVREWSEDGPYYANAWSPDGRWLAMIGQSKSLAIYDTSSRSVDQWRAIFSMKCDFVGHALAWGPAVVGGLLYLAYGGDSNEIFIMEIRTHEGTWETVLRINRDDHINTLDWSTDGLLAAGIGNGTVVVVDLAYLQSGTAVNEMDYNWQRQALTCYTEIRRNRGKNSIQSLRWLPAAPGSDRLLAVGGTDGEVEILDLTERQRCRGYVRSRRRK